MHLVCVRHFSFINGRDFIRPFTHLLRRMRIGVKQLHAVAFAVLANDFTSVLWFSIMNNHMLHRVWSFMMHVMVFGGGISLDFRSHDDCPHSHRVN